MKRTRISTALARAILAQTGLTPEIKWPNDILLRGKKVAGILTELSAELDKVKYIILGAGVDVNAGVDANANANANTGANANAKSGATTRAEANQLYDDLRRESRNLRANSRTQAKTTLQEDSQVLSPARAGVSGSASSSTEGSVNRR